VRAWLYGILSSFPGIIRKAGEWLIDRIYGVFSDGLRFARWIKYGVQKLNGAGKNFIRAFRSALDEIYWSVKWLILTEIPRRAKAAFNDAIKWAGATIDWLNKTLRAVISTLEKSIKAALSTLRKWAEDAVKWLTGQVNQLVANVKKLLERVFNLWSTPARLAEWLVGAMWSVFLRFMYSNRDKIARWFLQSSAVFTQWLARELEKVLVRFL
jgi:ABC-type proline/glycine betaine transport system permease subunit